MNATVVAYLGPKPAALRDLVTALQAELACPGLLPRPVDDVHATIIGLEGGRADVPALCAALHERLARAPLTLQFGGFADRDLALTSRGERLYRRTVTAAAGKAVLIGWPVDGTGEPTGDLDELRRGLGAFGARHRYHVTPDDRDPDAYLVIGDLDPGVDLRGRVARCRELLAATPRRVTLTASDVLLVTYTDTALPAASTRSWPLASPARQSRTASPTRWNSFRSE